MSSYEIQSELLGGSNNKDTALQRAQVGAAAPSLPQPALPPRTDSSLLNTGTGAETGAGLD